MLLMHKIYNKTQKNQEKWKTDEDAAKYTTEHLNDMTESNGI